MNKTNIKLVLITLVVTALVTAGISVAVVYPLLEDKETLQEPAQDPEPVKEEASSDKEEEASEPEDDRVRLDQEEYDRLMDLDKKYAEIELLQDFINDYYYLDPSEIDFVSAMTKGMFDALEDPYSQYYTPDEFTRLLEDVNNTYEGIGVVVAPGEDGYITVVSPISTSPGFEAGLKPGDKIIKVDGVEYSAEELSEAVKNIRGPKGTEVILTIRRGEEELIIPVTRRQIVLEAVTSEVIEDQIGYIRIASFDDDVAQEFLDHYNALPVDSLEGIIIDLRYNGGGYLDQCILLTDLLMDEGIIVKTKNRDGEEKVERSGAKYIDEKLVILINEGSASASEILTGAIKDNEEGTIVGTTTFGKGLVQTVRPLYQYDGAGFKLTVEQYFTPDDHYIHGVGIDPDIFVEDDPETEEDEQLEKALEIMREKLK